MRCMCAILLLLICASCASNRLTTTVQKPNIILIMADDIGIEGIGSYGSLSYKTPEIDKLSSEGIRFTHAYAQPLCTNTRIQLMSGMHNNRNWLYFGIMQPEIKTIGHYMKDAGYATCMAGKWQLQSYDPVDYPGSEKRRGTGMHPKDAGFDEYSLFHSLHTEDKGSRYANPTYLENGKLIKDLKGKYGPDMWVDYIKGFISRKKNEPFFVYYPMALPHRPVVPTPDSKDWTNPEKHKQDDFNAYFKDMVEYMDKCVGRIVKHVDSEGLGKTTLILFYSDNGTHKKVTSKTTWGDVKGGKGLTTNAGTHVPLIVRWTGKIKPAVNTDLVDSTDFIPTILEAAGKTLPKNHKLDGISFYPALNNESSTRRQYVYCFYDPRPGWDKDQFSRQIYARDKRYKLYDDGRLFDIQNDRLELKPMLKQKDSTELKKVRQRLGAVLLKNSVN